MILGSGEADGVGNTGLEGVSDMYGEGSSFAATGSAEVEGVGIGVGKMMGAVGDGEGGDSIACSSALAEGSVLSSVGAEQESSTVR